MRVYALGLVMIMVKRTPFSFEVKNVKVEIVGLNARDQVVKQTHFNVFNGMGKRTVISVLTLFDSVWEEVTKLCLVVVPMVESLHAIMRTFAAVVFGAFFSLSEFA